MSEPPKDFVNAVNTVFGKVPDDVPDWDKVIVPFSERPENLAKIQTKFDDAGLELTDKGIKAVQSDYRMSAAFLRDYRQEGVRKKNNQHSNNLSKQHDKPNSIVHRCRCRKRHP